MRAPADGHEPGSGPHGFHCLVATPLSCKQSGCRPEVTKCSRLLKKTTDLTHRQTRTWRVMLTHFSLISHRVTNNTACFFNACCPQCHPPGSFSLLPRLALPIWPSLGGLFACDAAKKALVSCSPQLKDIWLTSLSAP